MKDLMRRPRPAVGWIWGRKLSGLSTGLRERNGFPWFRMPVHGQSVELLDLFLVSANSLGRTWIPHHLCPFEEILSKTQPTYEIDGQYHRSIASFCYSKHHLAMINESLRTIRACGTCAAARVVCQNDLLLVVESTDLNAERVAKGYSPGERSMIWGRHGAHMHGTMRSNFPFN